MTSPSSRNLPPSPRAILRGHRSQVHAAAFCRANSRLLTGDADGFIIAWDPAVLRPRAVWRAHDKAILGIGEWGPDRVITHGRDNKLIVWHLTSQWEELHLDTVPPIEGGVGSTSRRPCPWMLHLLDVNAMNFCAFASCSAGGALADDLLVAVPNALVAEAVDVFHLPSQRRVCTVGKTGEQEQGMAMALGLLPPREGGTEAHGIQGRGREREVLDESKGRDGERSIQELQGIEGMQGTEGSERRYKGLTIVAAYESGLAVVSRFGTDGWTVTYRAQAHTQPILSLDVAVDERFFLTSGADALIVKHPVPTPVLRSMTVHQKAQQQPSLITSSSNDDNTEEVPRGMKRTADYVAAASPLKVINTGHAGQQGLTVRSDGRIFATAGWDGDARVYSVKTMRELAVLRWHETGCYVVAFSRIPVAGPGANVDADVDANAGADGSGKNKQQQSKVKLTGLDLNNGSSVVGAGPGEVRLVSVKERRIRHAKTAHWVAAGSKDGKISLWDIY